MEKKGKFTYLSWSWAVDKLIEIHPDATWEVKRFPMMVWETEYTQDQTSIEPYTIENDDGEVVYGGAKEVKTYRDIKNLRPCPDMKVPYMRTDTGYYVEVEVTIDGISRSQVHPVLDHRNKPCDKPNAFDINTSIQRCLAKAIALHGLGLHIYSGEDLPPKEQISPEEVDKVKVIAVKRRLNQMIDMDDPDETHDKIKLEWEALTNDERIAVTDQMRDKAPDSNKMYKNLLKDHLAYEPETTINHYDDGVQE